MLHQPIGTWARRLATLLILAMLTVGALLAGGGAHAAHAQTADGTDVTTPTMPTVPTVPSIDGSTSGTDSTTGASSSDSSTSATDSNVNINLDMGGSSKDSKKPNQGILVILVLTVLSVAPSLVILLSGFTRIIVVLSLARNAIGIPSIPPNQVLAGLALFLAIFVMSPTLSKVYHDAFQPLMDGKITQQEAYNRAQAPIRSFMLKQTRKGELAMFQQASGKKAQSAAKVPLTTLIPAFLLSELKTGFIIGFVIFIPFLVIDLVVSSALMSMGMFMLPPVMVSLPFKLLLFVMVGGWGLIAGTLISSFR